MEIINLSWGQLVIGFLILAIPAYILRRYRTGLNKKLGIATLRMTLQLLFVGYYLEILFELDNAWINMAWILVMVGVADFATIDRSELNRKWNLILPIFGAIFFGIILIDLFSWRSLSSSPNSWRHNTPFRSPAWCWATACGAT